MYYQTDKNLQSIADSIDSGWLESFYNQSPELNSWIEKRAFRNYAFEPEHDAVSIFRRIKYFDGVLVTNLNMTSSPVSSLPLKIIPAKPYWSPMPAAISCLPMKMLGICSLILPSA